MTRSEPPHQGPHPVSTSLLCVALTICVAGLVGHLLRVPWLLPTLSGVNQFQFRSTVGFGAAILSLLSASRGFHAASVAASLVGISLGAPSLFQHGLGLVAPDALTWLEHVRPEEAVLRTSLPASVAICLVSLTGLRAATGWTLGGSHIPLLTDLYLSEQDTRVVSPQTVARRDAGGGAQGWLLQLSEHQLGSDDELPEVSHGDLWRHAGQQRLVVLEGFCRGGHVR
jgi:hypothetical protein